MLKPEVLNSEVMAGQPPLAGHPSIPMGQTQYVLPSVACRGARHNSARKHTGLRMQSGGLGGQRFSALVALIRPPMCPKHEYSWGGVCPGNHESAGKRLGGRTRKGNPWPRRMLGQSAWSAARTKNTYVAVQFRRLAAKRGRKRAIVVIGHNLLVTGYHLPRKQCLISRSRSRLFRPDKC
jgi:hypothetical protein